MCAIQVWLLPVRYSAHLGSIRIQEVVFKIGLRSFHIFKGYENIDQEVFLMCHSPASVVIH